MIGLLEKYQIDLKSASDEDEAKAIIDTVQNLEKQLMQHYELACKKAEMQEEQRSAVLKNLDTITAGLKRLVLFE